MKQVSETEYYGIRHMMQLGLTLGDIAVKSGRSYTTVKRIKKHGPTYDEFIAGNYAEHLEWKQRQAAKKRPLIEVAGRDVPAEELEKTPVDFHGGEMCVRIAFIPMAWIKLIDDTIAGIERESALRIAELQILRRQLLGPNAYEQAEGA